jgi:GNAT superfamily N-acetyltransferase
MKNEIQKAGLPMDEETPHIEVRAVQVNDAPAIYNLDYNFETDRIYTLQVQERLLRSNGENEGCQQEPPALSFKLVETPVDPPVYKNFFADNVTVEDVEARLSEAEGGYVALADGQIAAVILLHVEEWRSVVRIDELIVGRQYRRYGVGSLLLNCASDWAREHGCWAIVLETQNNNFPAIQFYLRNGLEIWGINRNFYPPGPISHEVAILMGKQLSSTHQS